MPAPGSLDGAAEEIVSLEMNAEHHPFTAPVAADVPNLKAALDSLNQHSSPDGEAGEILRLTRGALRQLHSVRGQHYDLVCNGCELGGGSIRIHSADLQRAVLRVLGNGDAEAMFGHLLGALAQGLYLALRASIHAVTRRPHPSVATINDHECSVHVTFSQAAPLTAASP